MPYEISVTYHPAEVTFVPLLQPINVGTQYSNPVDMQGWVYQDDFVTYRGGILTQRWSPIPGSTKSNSVDVMNDATTTPNCQSCVVSDQTSDNTVTSTEIWYSNQNTFDNQNHMTLTFDLLTSGSMHAEWLPCTVCLPSMALIVQAVFLLECEHTDRHTLTDTTDHPTHALANAGICNYND